MSEREQAHSFDIKKIDNDFLDNPYPTYRLMREHDPVHRNPDGTWFLTRYDHVSECLKHPKMSSDKKIDFKPKFGEGPLFEHHTTSLVFNDDPFHARVRKLLSEAFTPRKMKELEPVIGDIIEGLLDRVEKMGEFDVIQDYALALPTAIIADMLGVPDEHRHKLHGWSNLILGALDPVVSDEKLQAGHDAVEEFGAILEELIAKRRVEPSGGRLGEVLAALIFGDVDGEKLSPTELVQNCIFLLNAGHETTANLVGNGIATLLDNPDQLERLRQDPDLILPADEEFLRYQSPLQLANRKAMEDIEFGGVTIPKDAFLFLGIGAANRDPEVFENPEQVDIGRMPNPQIAFGQGKHTCMGNTLGRIEGRIAVGRFVKRFPKLRLTGPIQWHGRARFRGLAGLPVAVN